MITAAGVRRLLSHRYPMLLVDRVLEAVPGERLVAVKAVTCNEPWYADLGDDPTDDELSYPAALLVESWAQSACVLASLRHELSRDKVALLGSMSGVRLCHPVFPGDVVEHRVVLQRSVGDTLIFKGDSVVAGDRVLSVASMVVALRPTQKEISP